MAYVSFNKSTTRLNAKTNGITGKLYFTNDSPTIVLDGKEYGITEEQESALQNMSSQVTAALEAANNAQAYMYSILGTLDTITEGTITSSEGQALEALIITKADAADLNNKVDKPSSAAKNNIAIFNSSRDIMDSGILASALAKKLNVDDLPIDIYCTTLIGNTDIFIDDEKSINVEAGRGIKVNISTNEYPACIVDNNNNILALGVNHLVQWVNNTNNTVVVRPGIIGYTDFGTMNTYTLGTNEAIRNLKNLIDERYEKPSNGIPSSDLTTAVQTSLGKADTALLTSYEIIDIGSQSGYYGTYPTGLYNLDLGDFNLYEAVNNAWNAKKIPVLTAHLSIHYKYVTIPLYREGTSPSYTYRGEIDVEGLYFVCANISLSSSYILTYEVYKKTSAGIQKVELSSSVQASLNKADTALQSSAISDMITVGDSVGYVIIGDLES